MAVRTRTTGSGSSASSHAVTISGASTGDRLIVGFANDVATVTATTSSTGWSSLGTVGQGTGSNHRATVFTKVATGSDTLTVNLSASQEAGWIVYVMQGDGGTPVVADNNGSSDTTGTVAAITGQPSGNYDSIIFLAIDDNPAASHTITPPSGYSDLTSAVGVAGQILIWAMDAELTGVTGASPADITWTNADQWITWHVLSTFSGPVEKEGSDSGTGTESGSVSATSTGSDSGTGSETGSVAHDGSDSGTGSEDGYVAEERLGGDTGGGTEGGDSSAAVTSGESGTGADDGGTTATSTGGDAGAGAELGHIAIPGEDSGTGTDVHDTPTLVTVTTGETGSGADGGYVETLFGDLVISLYAIDPDSAELVALPHYTNLSISRERNGRGSISLDYPAEGRNFDLLRSAVTDSRDLEVEIWTSGSPAGALRGYLQEASGDDTAETSVWKFGGGLLELRLDEAIVFPQDRGSLITDPNTGQQTYSNAKRELIVNADTPGEVMTLLLDQAQDRGALTDVTADFTTTHDSAGIPWAGTLSAKFSPGSTYTQILDKMVDLGLAEWAVVWDGTDRVLKLWANEGRGADLTVGPRPVVLRRGRNVLDAPRKWSVRDSGTTVLAAGREGVYQDATDATALARRGRRIEAYTSLQNASDEEAVLAFAQAELELVAPGLHSVEHGIGFLPGEPRPVVAFDIGDWLYSQTTTVLERLRVVQWTLTVDVDAGGQSLSGTVTLNDTVTDALLRLREKLDAISSGEAVVGTSQPGPNEPDLTPPAAPEGVVASSIAYQDPEHGPGQTLAMVSVGWLPVTTNADGSDSPLVQAAVYILDALETPDPEAPVGADWKWTECPQVVRDFADDLQVLWDADGNPDAETWLADYIAEATATPTAADDIGGYRVRYSYLGIEQVGGIPSSDPFPEDERFYYEATPPDGTAATSYDFGGVEGGSRLRIEVSAFDKAGNQGAWTSISHDTEQDATPPPVPSGPGGLKAWFRTLDIPWDGLGSEGEVMPFDFSHVRIWVGQGSDMTLPVEPVGEPTQFDPLETDPQYVAQLFGAGTWNLPDVPLGVGWYARLQAVDRTGNASAGSTIAGPVFVEQLVAQDLIDDIIDATKLGPDSVESAHIVNGAITTAKILDANIVTAKIADAAINNAKISDLAAGKITTGTMTATVTISGSIWTSTDTNATRLGLSAAGLQLYKTNSPSGGSTLIGEWRTSDGAMLVTGTFRSALSGERIHIDPDGTFRIYPTSGTNYSQISNVAGEAIWRGPVDGSGRSGRVNVNTLGVGLNFSAESEVPNDLRSELVLFDRRIRLRAPLLAFEVDETYSSPSGDRRIQFAFVNSSGTVINRSAISYFNDPSTDAGGFIGNDSGWKLDLNGNGDGRFMVTNGNMTGFGVGQAAAWDGPSSRELKEEIEDARAILDPLQAIGQARARKFKFTDRGTDDRTYVGVIAEELPSELQRPMTLPGGGETIGADLNSLIGVLWGAFGQILDQEIVSTSGTCILLRSQLDAGGVFRPGVTVEVPVTWDSVPPAAPTGGFVQMHSSFIWAGKVTAWIKTGSVTETGCTVVFKNISSTNVVVNETNDNLRVSATAIGLGLFTPPYVPPEES